MTIPAPAPAADPTPDDARARPVGRRRRRRGVMALATMALTVTAACSSDDPDPTPTDTGSVDTGSAGTDDAPTDSGPTDATATAGDGGTADDAETATITLVTYDSFPTEGTPINDRLADFTAETGIGVEILVAGDTGTMLAKAELAAGNPEGDVMWGVDNTFLGRAVEAGIFEPYLAEGIDAIPDEFTALVPDGIATPVDFGDVCLNYDIGALDGSAAEPPETLDDLLDPAYADALVVQNPATSSPGLAFLLATVAEYGEDGWQDYWRSLVDNGVAVTDDWTQAYYERFSYAGGDRPLVVSYGSSPPFEVLFAEEPLDGAPTGVVADSCFRQVEFAGVLAGTEHPDEARALVDFLISAEFQAELPLNVFVFPVSPEVELDPTFVEYAVIPETSRSLDPAVIDANRSDWIDEWTEIVIG